LDLEQALESLLNGQTPNTSVSAYSSGDGRKILRYIQDIVEDLSKSRIFDVKLSFDSGGGPAYSFADIFLRPRDGVIPANL
jgi:hypothetical protein